MEDIYLVDVNVMHCIMVQDVNIMKNAYLILIVVIRVNALTMVALHHQQNIVIAIMDGLVGDVTNVSFII